MRSFSISRELGAFAGERKRASEFSPFASGPKAAARRRRQDDDRALKNLAGLAVVGMALAVLAIIVGAA